MADLASIRPISNDVSTMLPEEKDVPSVTDKLDKVDSGTTRPQSTFDDSAQPNGPAQRNDTAANEEGETSAAGEIDEPEEAVSLEQAGDATNSSGSADAKAETEGSVKGPATEQTSTKAPVDSVAPAAVNDTAQSGAPEKPNATTDDGAEDVPATEASQKEVKGETPGKLKTVSEKIKSPFALRGRVTRRTYSGKTHGGGCVIF